MTKKVQNKDTRPNSQKTGSVDAEEILAAAEIEPIQAGAEKLVVQAPKGRKARKAAKELIKSGKWKKLSPQAAAKRGLILRKKGKKPRVKWTKKRKIVTFSILAVVLVVLVVAGLYLWKLASTVGQVFNGEAIDLLSEGKPLRVDENGRANILVFGTSEDDEGHKGADLADSIMVVSVNPETGDGNLVSIPRDLWVKLDEGCTVGYEAKINTVYMCDMQNHNNDKNHAGETFARKVGEIIGTEIPYYAMVNYTVVRDLVNALDGIDVDIYTADPRGINDKQTGLNIPAGVNHLDGDQALALARARNSKGYYGLPRSNFDREINQQRIVQAMKKKASVTGILLNPAQCFNILNALGDNIKTNVAVAEVKTALKVVDKIGDNQVVSLPLTGDGVSLVKTGKYSGQSVVQPTAGIFNYTDIHTYIKEAFSKVTTKDAAETDSTSTE